MPLVIWTSPDQQKLPPFQQSFWAFSLCLCNHWWTPLDYRWPPQTPCLTNIPVRTVRFCYAGVPFLYMQFQKDVFSPFQNRCFAAFWYFPRALGCRDVSDWNRHEALKWTGCFPATLESSVSKLGLLVLGTTPGCLSQVDHSNESGESQLNTSGPGQGTFPLSTM